MYGLDKIRIARLAKLPQLMMMISKSKSMRVLMRSYGDAMSSLSTVIFFSCAVIIFFSIMGLQLWKGRMGHCSYADYPQVPCTCLGCFNSNDLPILTLGRIQVPHRLDIFLGLQRHGLSPCGRCDGAGESSVVSLRRQFR